MRCDMKDPCHAPTPQWGGRKGTAAGCRPSDVACWLPQQAQRAYLSAQTRPKISHHTEALLKVASVCAALQHFWGKLIVCLLHMGWAETKNKTVQDYSISHHGCVHCNSVCCICGCHICE